MRIEFSTSDFDAVADILSLVPITPKHYGSRDDWRAVIESVVTNAREHLPSDVRERLTANGVTVEPVLRGLWFHANDRCELFVIGLIPATDARSVQVLLVIESEVIAGRVLSRLCFDHVDWRRPICIDNDRFVPASAALIRVITMLKS